MAALTHVLQFIVQLIVFALALPATAFPIVYALFFRWWKYDAGRTVMAATTALALLVDLSIVMRLVRPIPIVEAAVSVFVLLAVLAASSYKLSVLLRKLTIQGCEREENAKR